MTEPGEASTLEEVRTRRTAYPVSALVISGQSAKERIGPKG